MKRKNSALSIILALVVALTFPVSSFAYEANEDTLADIESGMLIDLNEEINRALDGITDLETTEFAASVAASIPVDVYVTTRALTSSQTRSVYSAFGSEDNQSNVYATTSVAVLSSDDNEKEVTDSEAKKYVTATITIYWRDNAGLCNDFLGASGGWTIAKNPTTNTYPYLADRGVYLRATQATQSSFGESYAISNDTFYIDADKMPVGYWSYSITSTVTIYDTWSDLLNQTNGYTFDFKVSTPLVG